MVNNITKSRKAILWLLALVMALTAVIPLSTLKANAAKGGNEIKYEGKISWGGTTVGKFKIGNTLAFCLEHKKDTPATGTGYTQTPYDNPKVTKVLYYGWGGQEPWKGFQGNEAKGYVITSLALDHYHTGTKHDMAGYNEFIKFIESQPAPKDDVIGFDKTSAKVHWDAEKKKQITEEVTIVAQGASDNDGTTIDFTVPNGVTMVMADGTTKTGNVSLKQGDKFHLEADAKVFDGTWTTGKVGHTWKYQSFILKTPAASVQDLARLDKFVDPTAQSSLSVKWLDFGEFELTKIDEMSQFLDGAEFEIKSLEPATGYDKGVRYKAENGKLLIEALPVGTYTLTEVVKPDSYDKPVKAFTIVIQKNKKTTQIAVNRLNPSGVVKILKTDKDSKANIEGAEFTLKAAETIYDTVTFEKLFDKGAVVDKKVTGKDGVCELKAPSMGKYIAIETKPADGYKPNGKEYPVEFRQQDYTTKVYYHNEMVENELTETAVSKVDATTGKELSGATLKIIDPVSKEIVEEWVSSEKPHIIKGLTYGKEYILKETIAPKTHELNEQEIRFTVGDENKVIMKDEPIKISGQIDKRQSLFNKGDEYKYSIDYRSTSNTWADEFNMKDRIDCAIAGYANVTKVKTPVSFEDYDGKMNVWYKTNKTPSDYDVDAKKYNACKTNPHNDWNKNNDRVESYVGYKLWKENVSTLNSETLNVKDLNLTEGEYITGIAFEHGRIEKGFATRTNNWDRNNIKATNDNLKDILPSHTETFDLSKANGITKDNRLVHYEPAVVSMKVVDKNAALGLKDFWNSAEISIYRNLGGTDLEDHDNDKVVQKYPIGSIEMSDKDNLLGNIIKTGDPMAYILPLIVLTLVASATVAIMTNKRKGSK